jgi:hypothetical protein
MNVHCGVLIPELNVALIRDHFRQVSAKVQFGNKSRI